MPTMTFVLGVPPEVFSDWVVDYVAEHHWEETINSNRRPPKNEQERVFQLVWNSMSESKLVPLRRPENGKPPRLVFEIRSVHTSCLYADRDRGCIEFNFSTLPNGAVHVAAESSNGLKPYFDEILRATGERFSARVNNDLYQYLNFPDDPKYANPPALTQGSIPANPTTAPPFATAPPPSSSDSTPLPKPPPRKKRRRYDEDQAIERKRRMDIVERANKLRADNPQWTWKQIAAHPNVGTPERTLRQWRHDPTLRKRHK